MIKVVLSSIIDIISGGTPKTSVSEYWNGEIGWLSITDFNDDKRFVYHTEKTISERGVKESNTKFLNKGDIIISARGTVGAIAQIGCPMCFNQSCFGIRGKKDIVNNDYLFYALKNYVKNIVKRSQGSVFNTINLASFDLMELDIHKDLPTQRSIAKVLSDLDTKIEFNNKINRELEAMVKTIYDYWFVQFDFPNENGKPYKSSGGKMIYNAELKREIPEGWAVKTLGKFLSTKLGGTPSTIIKKYWMNGEFSWLNSSEVANFPIISSELKISKTAIDNSSTTLLPKGTVVISITRHIRASILGIDSCANQSVIGILESQNLLSSYLYPLIKNEIPKYLSLRTGAQQPHINKEILDNTKIIKPDDKILLDYYQVCNPIYNKIIVNAFENKHLIELREWLLPMLMNGQVTLKEVEENLIEYAS